MIGWCVFLERVIIESPNPKRKLNMYTSANKKTCFMMAAAFATHTQHPFFFLFSSVSISLFYSWCAV